MKKKLIFLGFFVVALIIMLRSVSDNSSEPSTLKKTKYDKPDEYLKYHNLLRSRIGSERPDYDDNYIAKEFDKFKNKDKNYLTKMSENFVSHGPSNMGGRTRALIVSLKDTTENTWIAGSVAGGIWISTDEGANWSNLTDDQMPNLAISCIVQSAQNPDILYAGTGEGFGNVDAVQGNGIYKSLDHGTNWSHLTATDSADFLYVNRMAVDPNNADILIVATNTGIFKSYDGGVMWTRVLGNLGRVQDLKVNPQNFTVQIAAVRNVGIYRSADAGDSWTKVKSLSDGRIELAYSSLDTNKVAAVVDDGISSLFISLNSGLDWSATIKPEGAESWLGGQGWYDNVVAFDPVDSATLFVGGIDLFKVALTNQTQIVIDTVDEIIQESEWLGLVNFGGNKLGGGLATASGWNSALADQPVIHVELLFGPGKTQKAHRFWRDTLAGSTTYFYMDYADVPFEVWDRTNNRQLMASFRDYNNKIGNGTWDVYWQRILGSLDSVNEACREYVFIHNIDYADTANPSVAVTGTFTGTAGINHLLQYVFWPQSLDGQTYNASNIPTTVFTISRLDPSDAYVLNSVNRISYWNGSGDTYVHADQHNIVFSKIDKIGKNYTGIFTNDGAIFRSLTKGSSFSERTNGYVTSQLYGADRHPTQERFIGGMQDNGTWVKNAAGSQTNDWIERLGGDGYDAVWHKSDPNKLAGTLYYSRVHISKNGGSSFGSASLNLGDGNAPFVTVLSSSALKPDWLFTYGSTGIYKSSNFGDSWTAIAFPNSKYSSRFASGGDVKVSLSNSNIVWAASTILNGTSAEKPLISVNGGTSFSEVSFDFSSLADFAHYIASIATDPVSDSTAYITFVAAGIPKIIKTSNLGQTWTDITGNGLPNVGVQSMIVVPRLSGNELWAGTEIGLFISTDDGQNWTKSNSNMPSVFIYDMQIVGNQVVLATHGRGFWTFTVSDYQYPAIQASVNLLQNPSYSQNANLILKSNFNLTYKKLTISQDGQTSVLTMSDLSVSDNRYKSNQFQLNGTSPISISFEGKYANSPDTSKLNYNINQISSFSPQKDFVIDNIYIHLNDQTLKDKQIIAYHRYKTLETLPDNGAMSSPHFIFFGSEGQRTANEFELAFRLNNEELKTAEIYLLKANKWVKMPHRINEDKISISSKELGYYQVFFNKGIQNQNGSPLHELSFELNQNYPNPFNPTTTIAFTIAEKTSVKLEIFNTLGQRIKTLVDGELTAQTYKLEWNGLNDKGIQVASGIYFYRLTAGNWVKSNKMILMK